MRKPFDVFDVQNLLREHADQGFDLTHPHGIFLHGRLYPTSHKRAYRIDDYSDKLGIYAPFTRVGVDIPLESGNVIKVKSSIYPKVENIPHHTWATLYAPRSHFNHDTYPSAHHSYTPLYLSTHSDDKKYNVELTPENTHEVLQEFSKAPFRGTSLFTRADGRTVSPEMSPEEFTQHTKAFRAVPHNIGTEDEIREWHNDGEVTYKAANTIYTPKKTGHIVVFDYSDSGFVGGQPGQDSKHHLYDPHTEQLHHLD